MDAAGNVTGTGPTSGLRGSDHRTHNEYQSRPATAT